MTMSRIEARIRVLKDPKTCTVHSRNRTRGIRH